MEFYLWADALCYMLYLSQYPMLAVYVSWFHPGLGAYSALKKTHQHEAGGGAVPSSVSLPTTFGFDGVKTDASLLVKNNNAPSIQGPKVSVGGGADSFMRRFGDDQRTNG
jgi:hypothetical protein